MDHGNGKIVWEFLYICCTLSDATGRFWQFGEKKKGKGRRRLGGMIPSSFFLILGFGLGSSFLPFSLFFPLLLSVSVSNLALVVTAMKGNEGNNPDEQDFLFWEVMTRYDFDE